MKKAIVTTTINPPTKALLKFIEIGKRDGWEVVIVGDKKTPHGPYVELTKENPNVHYLHPDWQESKFPALSILIGWNCIQRRNIGLIHAYGELEAEVIATVDDDNIPYEDWGKNCKVGEEIEVITLVPNTPVFDPLSYALENPTIWHRGFPIQMLGQRQISPGGLRKRKVLVQADLWDGAPDIDAVCRITLNPEVRFRPSMPMFAGSTIAPFNSQNTFLHRSLFPTYFLFPHIGRMDDIWAAYVTQFEFPDSVIFAKASVYQDRNEHDLVKDLQAEMIGYEKNHEFVTSEGDWTRHLPQESLDAYDEYKKCFA